MTGEAIRSRLGGLWLSRADGWHQGIELLQVRAMAGEMRSGGARFAALTVRPTDGAFKLAWHFDAAGELLTLEARLPAGATVPSILDLWPGADWAEREARDYYALRFDGRADTPPLMLRDGDAPGVFLDSKEGALS
jgi:hypothetical protein